ncbi:MAG: flavodoxin [Clostridiales bacterium]|nr:flavodoxin [Clostridiales bacterium]
MKAIVIYQSKTGFTKRYAEWIAVALGCEAKAWKDAQSMSLADYDTLIYGGWFHAGSIVGLKKFLRKAEPLGKKLAVFAVGAGPAESPDIESSLRRNFTGEQYSRIPAFYMPGGLNYEKMGAVDKAMMAVFRAMVKKQEGENSQMYQMLCKSYDLADEKYIEPLVEACRGM